MEGGLPAWGWDREQEEQGIVGGDKGKSQQKVLVFASGIRKVFGHPFNWGNRKGVLRKTVGGLQ